MAPLLCLQEELTDAEVLLGFRSAAHAQAAALFAGRPDVVTDDGSVGRRALVTEPLAAALDAGRPATVFACGPPPMLEAVRALCAERGVPARLPTRRKPGPLRGTGLLLVLYPRPDSNRRYRLERAAC